MTQETIKKTFILHLQFKQNGSWQGSIKWVESKKTILFRSALEMMKIIDSACQQGGEIEIQGLDEFKEMIVGE